MTEANQANVNEIVTDDAIVTPRVPPRSYAARVVEKAKDPKAAGRIAPLYLAKQKARLVEETARDAQRKADADRRRKARAGLKKVQPRPGFHFSAEVDGAMNIEDHAPLEHLLDPHYWSRGYNGRSGATFFVGKKIRIMPRGIVLRVTKIEPGPAPDAHLVYMEEVSG